MIEILKKSIEIAMASKHPSAPEFIKEVSQAIAEAEKDEPVAWITNYGKGWLRWHRESDRALNKTSIPLYTHPQPRKE